MNDPQFLLLFFFCAGSASAVVGCLSYQCGRNRERRDRVSLIQLKPARLRVQKQDGVVDAVQRVERKVNRLLQGDTQFVVNHREAASRLGVSREVLRQWQRDPGFPDCRHGYDLDEIQLWRQR